MSGLIKSQCRFTHCLLCFFQISKGPTVQTGCSKQFFPPFPRVSVQDCSPTKVVTVLCHQSTKLPTAVHSFFLFFSFHLSLSHLGSTPRPAVPPFCELLDNSGCLYTQRPRLRDTQTKKELKGNGVGREKNTHTHTHKTSLYPLNSCSQTNQYHSSSMSIFSSSCKQQAQSQRHSLPCSNTPWSVSTTHRMTHTSLSLLNTNRITPLMTRPWGRWFYAETSKCFVSVSPSSFGEYTFSLVFYLCFQVSVLARCPLTNFHCEAGIIVWFANCQFPIVSISFLCVGMFTVPRVSFC